MYLNFILHHKWRKNKTARQESEEVIKKGDGLSYKTKSYLAIYICTVSTCVSYIKSSQPQSAFLTVKTLDDQFTKRYEILKSN